jgi:hypothetical protein
MSKSYVLAPAFAGVQFWNADKSDLVEVRRQPGQKAEIPADIPAEEAKRLLSLGAIVEPEKVQDEESAPETLVPEEPAGNASRDEWAKYADSLGLTLEPGMGRDDIKQAVADSRG